MNGQAWVCPPWKIHIFSWKTMVKRWNLLVGWHIFKGYVSFRCFRQCIFWWQLSYLDGNCVLTGFNGLPFSALKEAFLFFTTYDSKKKQLWRTLYQRQVQKNERIVHLLPFFVFWYRYCWWKKFGHSATDHCLPTLPFVHLAWCVAPPWRCSWTQPGGYCTIETHTHISNVYIYIYVQYIYNIYI